MDWIRDVILHWRSKLYLEHHSISYRKALCVDNDAAVMASVATEPAYNRADITFREDVTDNDEWREVILHEILHVAHGSIDAVVREVIIPQLPSVSQSMAQQMYRQANEAFITNLSLAIFKLSKGTCNDGSSSTNTDSDDGSGRTQQRGTVEIAAGSALVPVEPDQADVQASVPDGRSLPIRSERLGHSGRHSDQAHLHRRREVCPGD